MNKKTLTLIIALFCPIVSFAAAEGFVEYGLLNAEGEEESAHAEKYKEKDIALGELGVHYHKGRNYVDFFGSDVGTSSGDYLIKGGKHYSFQYTIRYNGTVNNSSYRPLHRDCHLYYGCHDAH